MCFYMFFHQRYQYYPFNLHLIGACCIETSACKEKPGFSHFSHTAEFQGVDRHHAACLRISLFGTLSLVRQDSWCTLEHCLNIAEILAAPCQHFCLSTQYMPRCGPKPVEIQSMLLYFGKTLCYRF